MITYIVDREIAGIGLSGAAGPRLAAARSIEAVARLAPRIRWCHSWVGADRLVSLYRADSIASVRDHARLAGFPNGDIARVIDELAGDDADWRAWLERNATG